MLRNSGLLRPVEDLQVPIPVEQLPVHLVRALRLRSRGGRASCSGGITSAGWSSAGRWSGGRENGAVGGTACPAYAFSLLSVVFVVA